MSVYFDHNASAPLLDEVLDEMLPIYRSAAGNASSLHRSGRFLRSAIETARQRVASLVNAEPAQVVFTSGGSEANNLAIKGFVQPGATLAVSSIEHASVLEPARQMQSLGCDLRQLEVSESGELDLDAFDSMLSDKDAELISVQMANNETGVIQAIGEISRIAHVSGSLFHSDASQAVGKIDVDVQALDIDLLTLSGHKFGAPQGVGALIIRNGQMLQPLISGGPQENGRRAGTENAALIAGLGKAAELAELNLNQRQAYLLELRNFFEQRLKSTIAGVSLFGDNAQRLPNTSYFSIPCYHGETLLMQLDQAGFELSSGSACHSQVTRPSHVLQAMRVDDTEALNAVRVSFGMNNTCQQIDQLVDTMAGLIERLPAAMRQRAS